MTIDLVQFTAESVLKKIKIGNGKSTVALVFAGQGVRVLMRLSTCGITLQ